MATGAVTLVQRFGSALNLNIHLHMLCLEGVYVPRPDGGLRFRRVKAPEREELEHLVQQIAERVGRALERMGLLQRDAESAWLELPPAEDTDAMRQLLGSSVTYRIAVGPQAGRKARGAAHDHGARGRGAAQRAGGEGARVRMRHIHVPHPCGAT